MLSEWGHSSRWRGGRRCWSAAGVALVLLGSSASFAQQSDEEEDEADGPTGQCMTSPEPHECPERCPTFDTCFIESGGGQLYYEVDDQRFDCDGLDCGEASQLLGDYCCQRGAFAPPGGGCGGCALAPERRGNEEEGWLLALALAWVALLGARRRRFE